MKDLETFKNILINIAKELGVGWKADLINIDQDRYCYYRECSIFGSIRNRTEIDTPKRIDIGYNPKKNKIYAASVYQNNIIYSGNERHWHTHESIKLSLNNRKISTAGKRIKDELLNNYDDVVKQGLKLIKLCQEREEKEENILNCIKKMIDISQIYHSKKFSVEGIKERVFFQCYFEQEKFSMSIEDLNMDKFVRILQILKE